MYLTLFLSVFSIIYLLDDDDDDDCRFTFHGVNNRSVEACLQEHNLILRLLTEKGEEASLSVPLNVKENTWFWLGISHTKKNMRRSTMAVFINEELLCEEKFAYPDNLDGGGKSAISIAFARSETSTTQVNSDDYRFQMCAMGVLQGVLSEMEMHQLYMLHHGPSYSLCETAAVDEWASIQRQFLEKVVNDDILIMF